MQLFFILEENVKLYYYWIGGASPHPPFIIPGVFVIGSPHPPRILGRLLLLRLVLFFLILRFFEKENKDKPLEKNCFKLFIIYILLLKYIWKQLKDSEIYIWKPSYYTITILAVGIVPDSDSDCIGCLRLKFTNNNCYKINTK